MIPPIEARNSPNDITSVSDVIRAHDNSHDSMVGQQFRIHRPVTKEELRRLTQYPDREFGLVVHEPGEIIVTVGDARGVALHPDGHHPDYYPRIVGHSHPLGGRQEISGQDVPGIQMYRDGTDRPQTLHLLFTQRGITSYGWPRIDPSTGRPPEDTTIDAMLESWLNKNGFTTLPAKVAEAIRPNLISLPALPPKDKDEWTRRFVHESGIFISETAWDDTAGINKILNSINHGFDPTRLDALN